MLDLVLSILKLTTYEEVVAWRMTEPAYTPKSFQSMGTLGPRTVSDPVPQYPSLANSFFRYFKA
jgi:hypothetical protein